MMIRTFKRFQQGSVLIEAMMAILIFSFGVLGIVGLQATMIGASSDAKYRSEASFFANRLLGEMWAGNRSSLAALSEYATSGPKYTTWYNQIKNTNIATGLLGLPGADAYPPVVSVSLPAGAPTPPTSYDVEVTVFWKAPGNDMQKHVVKASITAD